MDSDNIYNFTLEVENEDRVDKLLSSYFLEYSRSTIQKWISSNNVKINGNLCTQKDKIKKNCLVSINIVTKPEVNLIAEDIPLDIIDENDDYILVNKPSGMVTHIAPGNYNGTLQNALFYKYPELANIPRTGIIHRLDKDTSGILVVSRSLTSHNYLSKQLQDRKFKKVYHAIISGVFDKATRIEEPIGRHPVDRKKMTVSSNGRFACSIVKPLEYFSRASHVEVDIITGRTHQIRVHMAYKKHPIVGDKLYGFKKNIFSKSQNILCSIESSFGQYLHAYYLSFSDPRTNEIKEYRAPYPREYRLLLDALSE